MYEKQEKKQRIENMGKEEIIEKEGRRIWGKREGEYGERGKKNKGAVGRRIWGKREGKYGERGKENIKVMMSIFYPTF